MGGLLQETMRVLNGSYLTKGNEHAVFLVEDGKEVFKGPLWWRQMVGAKVAHIITNLHLLDQYEVPYVPTEVLAEPVCIETPQRRWHFPYGMTQPKVEMNTLRESHFRDNPTLRNQMIRLLGVSGELQRRYGIAIDFTGMAALEEFAPAWFHGKPIDLGLPNMIVQDGKAVLADVGLFHLNTPLGLIQRPLAHAQNDLIRRVLAQYVPEQELRQLRALTPPTPGYISVMTGWAFDESRKLLPQRD